MEQNYEKRSSGILMKKKAITDVIENPVPIVDRISESLTSLSKKASSLEVKLGYAKQDKALWDGNVKKSSLAISAVQQHKEAMVALHSKAVMYAEEFRVKVETLQDSLDKIAKHQTKLQESYFSLNYNVKEKELKKRVNENLDRLGGMESMKAVEPSSSIQTAQALDDREILGLLYTADAMLELFDNDQKETS